MRKEFAAFAAAVMVAGAGFGGTAVAQDLTIATSLPSLGFRSSSTCRKSCASRPTSWAASR